MTVSIKDLDLKPVEEARLAVLAGPRYKSETKKLVLTAEKFPNRVENKR